MLPAGIVRGVVAGGGGKSGSASLLATLVEALARLPQVQQSILLIQALPLQPASQIVRALQPVLLALAKVSPLDEAVSPSPPTHTPATLALSFCTSTTALVSACDESSRPTVHKLCTRLWIQIVLQCLETLLTTVFNV